MIRKAFVMQVNPDAHEEYERRHTPIWPELEAVLKDHGAHHYAIFLDTQRNLLFATVEIESEERWNAVAHTDVCQRWWKHMRDVMPSNPDNSPVSAELKAFFNGFAQTHLAHHDKGPGGDDAQCGHVQYDLKYL
jgi:L-rhamnose mutarotase